MEHDGTSWVARVGMSSARFDCARCTHEVHLLVDVARSRIATAVRWVTAGERSTLSYREVGEGNAKTGCGVERSAPTTGWLGFDGTWLD